MKDETMFLFPVLSDYFSSWEGCFLLNITPVCLSVGDGRIPCAHVHVDGDDGRVSEAREVSHSGIWGIHTYNLRSHLRIRAKLYQPVGPRIPKWGLNIELLPDAA